MPSADEAFESGDNKVSRGWGCIKSIEDRAERYHITIQLGPKDLEDIAKGKPVNVDSLSDTRIDIDAAAALRGRGLSVEICGWPAVAERSRDPEAT